MIATCQLMDVCHAYISIVTVHTPLLAELVEASVPPSTSSGAEWLQLVWE